MTRLFCGNLKELRIFTASSNPNTAEQMILLEFCVREIYKISHQKVLGFGGHMTPGAPKPTFRDHRTMTCRHPGPQNNDITLGSQYNDAMKFKLPEHWHSWSQYDTPTLEAGRTRTPQPLRLPVKRHSEIWGPRSRISQPLGLSVKRQSDSRAPRTPP